MRAVANRTKLAEARQRNPSYLAAKPMHRRSRTLFTAVFGSRTLTRLTQAALLRPATQKDLATEGIPVALHTAAPAPRALPNGLLVVRGSIGIRALNCLVDRLTTALRQANDSYDSLT